MIRRLFRDLKFKLAGGYFPIFARKSVLFGERLVVIEREDYELMMRELEWRWLRAALMGMALIAVMTVAAFTYGVRVGWDTDTRSFRFLCARVIEKHFAIPPEIVAEAFPLDYAVADWSLVPKENFVNRAWPEVRKRANKFRKGKRKAASIPSR